MTSPRLITFDCYGTLIDWFGGLRATLIRLFPAGADLEPWCRRYVELEMEVEAGPYRPYREVMARALQRLCEEADVPLAPQDRDVLGVALPGWTPYPDVPGALAVLQEHFALGILSNIDDDLLTASLTRLGIRPQHCVSAAQVQSYKPAETHFRRMLELSGLEAGDILHVAGSLQHDIVPARQLGLRHLWVNRLGEARPDWLAPGQEVRDLSPLPRLAAGA